MKFGFSCTRRDCTAWEVAEILQVASLLAAMALSTGCGSISTGVNTRLVVVQEEITEALRRDDLARARQLAIELERLQPAADTYALLGDVLWRTGELVDAEGLYRRAEAGGAPGGRLGLARATLSRGEVEGVRELVEPLRAVPLLAREAHSLLAAIEWLECNCPTAAMELAAASGARDEGGQWLGVEAIALQSLPADRRVGLLQWQGAGSELELDADGRVPVVVDGRELRLALALDGRHTTIGGAAAAALVPDLPSPAVSAAVADVVLGDLRSRAVVRIDPQMPSDGTLGLDLLANLAWELSVGERTLHLARDAASLPAPDLQSTYWGTVRLPRDGLGAQLLLRPRVGGRVLTAVIDVSGPSRLSEFVAPELADSGEGEVSSERLDLQLRLGAWRQTVSWTVDDLLPMGRGGLVAPRAVIGVEVMSQLRVRWLPDRLQVSYEQLPAGTLPSAGR